MLSLSDLVPVKLRQSRSCSRLLKVAHCIPVLSWRCIGKCAARVLKRSACTHHILEKILTIYEKNFKCQLSNAIKETKPKVWRVFTLRHRASLGFMVNLLNFIKHLFCNGEMNFLRDISEITQRGQEFVLD